MPYLTTPRFLIGLFALTAFVSPVTAQEQAPPPKIFYKNSKTVLKPKTFDAKGLWPGVMASVGSYNKTEKCWVLNIKSRYFCMRPAKFEKFGYGDRDIYSFVISGTEKVLRGKDFETAFNFPTSPGVVSFIYLSRSENDNNMNSISLTDTDGLYAFGSNGLPPSDDNFKLVEFAGESYAWIITSYSNGSGGVFGSVTTIMASPFTYFELQTKQLAQFVSSVDNSGGCGKSVEIPCEEEKISYKFSSSGKDAFDLELTYTSRVGDKKTFEINDASPVKYSKTIVVPFNNDPNAPGYVLPNKKGQTLIDWFVEESKKVKR